MTEIMLLGKKVYGFIWTMFCQKMTQLVDIPHKRLVILNCTPKVCFKTFGVQFILSEHSFQELWGTGSDCTGDGPDEGAEAEARFRFVEGFQLGEDGVEALIFHDGQDRTTE